MTDNEQRSDDKRFRSLAEFDKEYFSKGTESLPSSFDNALRVDATFIKSPAGRSTVALERKKTVESQKASGQGA